MRLLRLASELFYVATSVLGALPAFAYSVWGGKFLHSGAALVTMIASVAWVAGGSCCYRNGAGHATAACGS